MGYRSSMALTVNAKANVKMTNEKIRVVFSLKSLYLPKKPGWVYLIETRIVYQDN